MSDDFYLDNKDGRYVVRRLIGYVEKANKKSADRKSLCNDIGVKGKSREGIKYMLANLHKIEAGLILTDHKNSREISLLALDDFMRKLLPKEEVKLVLQGNRKRRSDVKKRKGCGKGKAKLKKPGVVRSKSRK